MGNYCLYSKLRGKNYQSILYFYGPKIQPAVEKSLIEFQDQSENSHH